MSKAAAIRNLALKILIPTAKSVKRALKPIYKQTIKLPDNMPIEVKGFYGAGSERIIGSAQAGFKSLSSTARNIVDPTRTRSNEIHRAMGMSRETRVNILNNQRAKEALINDPTSWIKGKVKVPELKKIQHFADEIPEDKVSKLIKQNFKPRIIHKGTNKGRTIFEKLEKTNFTTEAQAKLTKLDKNTWGELYKQQALMIRSGISPVNKAMPKFFEKHLGKVHDLTKDMDKIRALGYSQKAMQNIISKKTWNFSDPSSLKVMEMYNKKLNMLTRDIQYDINFRDLVRVINTNKRLKSGTLSAKKAAKVLQFQSDKKLKGLDPSSPTNLKQKISKFFNKDTRKKRSMNIDIVDGKPIISYSPSLKSNQYTGGINGKVVFDPKDPEHVYLMPTDAFDMFGKKMEWVSKNVLGLKKELLNVMGVKKIKIPDHRLWNTPKFKAQNAAFNRVSSTTTKKTAKDILKNVKPENKVIIPRSEIFRYGKLGKKVERDLESLLTTTKSLSLPKKRYVKSAIGTSLGTVALGGATYGGYNKLFPKKGFSSKENNYASKNHRNSDNLFPME